VQKPKFLIKRARIKEDSGLSLANS